MYRLVIDSKNNQKIKDRKREIFAHSGEEIIAVIDNSKEFNIADWFSFEFPMYSEGISKIELMYDNSNLEGLYKEANARLDFIHNDVYHHNDTLKDHCDKIKNYLKGNDKITDDMILFHDFGKPKTVKQNPKNPKYLCYYQHDNIGCREIISYLSTKDIESYYEVLLVTNYHMSYVNYIWISKHNPEIFEFLNKDNHYLLIKQFGDADKNS